ncbi:KH domain-containing protein [Patescibacteria group bacterium]|nr:KH domain-containing protein [Patescibacteria group bacterium]
MQEYIEFLVKQIVTNPESVTVEEIKEDDSSFTYVISVAKEDMGIVIGREGRTIKSLRTLAKVKAVKDDIRVNITLNEPADNETEDNETKDSTTKGSESTTDENAQN